MTDVVANEYISLCRLGKFEEAIECFFSTDHVRVESLDMVTSPIEIRGIDAARENMQGSGNESEVHGFSVEGPYVKGNRFIVRFTIDMTFKTNGARDDSHEDGSLYCGRRKDRPGRSLLSHSAHATRELTLSFPGRRGCCTKYKS